MADRFWVGGTGNWSDTNHWSTSDGGTTGASVPTSADNAKFTNNSAAGTFTVTIDTAGSCLDFDASGITNAARKMTFGLTTAQSNFQVFGSWSNPTSTFYARTGVSTDITFAATSSGKTITANGVSFACNITFNGVGGVWTLGSAYSTGAARTDITNGTFDTSAASNYSVSTGRISLSNSSVLNFNASAIATNLAGAVIAFVSTAMFNCGTSTLTISTNGAATFDGGGAAFNNVVVTLTAPGTLTINSVTTFANFTLTSPAATGIINLILAAAQTITGTLTLGVSNTAIRRLFLSSSVMGTTRTITTAAVAAIADVDFRDISAAGVAGTWSGTRLGDCGGNSNITTTAPKTVYWNLAGSNNWSATGWATTNNGAPAINNFPLAQDTATFTEAGAITSVTFDATWNVGTVQMADGISNRTTAFTLAFGGLIPAIYGSVTLFSNLTMPTTGTFQFSGRGTQLITSASKTFNNAVNINGPGGVFKFVDAYTQGAALTTTLTNGTLDGNGQTVTLVNFALGVGTKTLTIGSTTWTVSGSGTAWSANTNVAGLTVSAATGKISMTSASAKTFAGGAKSWPVLEQAGTGNLTITQANTFVDILWAAVGSILFPASTTTTLSTPTLANNSGGTATISSSTGGTRATLSAASGTVSVTNTSITDSSAAGGTRWQAYLTNGNTNGGNNLGWFFTEASRTGLLLVGVGR